MSPECAHLLAVVAGRPLNQRRGDYRRGVNHRMRKHYWHASARGAMSEIARTDRDATTERVELSERVQDALHHQNPVQRRTR